MSVAHEVEGEFGRDTSGAKSELTISPATYDDVFGIVAGIEDFVEHSGYGGAYAVNRDHVTKVVMELIHSPDGIVAVMKNGSAFAGAYLGLRYANLISGEKHLGELLIYTKPEMRGHGRKLLRFAEQWATQGGCVKSHLSHHEIRDVRLDRLYLAWGYQPLERSYVKDLV